MEKPDDQKNGIEIEIQRKYMDLDLSWFPLHRTKNILEKEDEDNLLRQKVDRLKRKFEILLNKQRAAAKLENASSAPGLQDSAAAKPTGFL